MLENTIQKTRLKQLMPELSKNFLDYMDKYKIEDYVNDSFSFLTGSKKCEVLELMNEAFINGQEQNNMDKLLEEAVQHLRTVCQHANEDCPTEYRTKWFNPAIREAYEFIRKIEVSK